MEAKCVRLCEKTMSVVGSRSRFDMVMLHAFPYPLKVLMYGSW